MVLYYQTAAMRYSSIDETFSETLSESNYSQYRPTPLNLEDREDNEEINDETYTNSEEDRIANELTRGLYRRQDYDKAHRDVLKEDMFRKQKQEWQNRIKENADKQYRMKNSKILSTDWIPEWDKDGNFFETNVVEPEVLTEKTSTSFQDFLLDPNNHVWNPRVSNSEEVDKIPKWKNVLNVSFKLVEQSKKLKEEEEKQTLFISNFEMKIKDKRENQVPWGYKAMKMFRYYISQMKINGGKVELSEIQQMFVKQMSELCIPQFFGWEYSANRQDILDEMGTTTNPKALALTMGRQNGKSIVNAICQGSLMKCCRGISVLINANSMTTVKQIMDDIKLFYTSCLTEKEQDKKMILRSNNKMICFVRPDAPEGKSEKELLDGGWYNILRACSNDADKNRGLRGDIINIDEAMFTNKRAVEEFLAPILKKGDAILIVMSTLKADQPDHWFTKMLELHKVDPCLQQLVRCISVEYKPGNEWLQPKFNTADGDGAKLAKFLMGNDEALFQQEAMGMILMNGETGKLIRYDWINRLRNKIRVSFADIKNPVLTTFIDPKSRSVGTGKHEAASYLAVITVVHTMSDRIIIISLDEFESPVIDEQTKFLYNYFASLKSIHGMTDDIEHEIFIEHNFGGDAYPYIYEKIPCDERLFPNARIIQTEMKNGKSIGGVWTGQNRNIALNMFVRDIHLDYIFFCAELRCSIMVDLDKILKSWASQIMNLNPDKNGHVSGKHNGKRDDLAVCTFMVIYWARKSSLIRKSGEMLKNKQFVQMLQDEMEYGKFLCS
jgi:hypothetical protein